MPNKSSKASHIPERTCLICRKKRQNKEMMRFKIMNDTYIIDCKHKLDGRGYYVCNDNECIANLDKRIKKISKKKVK